MKKKSLSSTLATILFAIAVTCYYWDDIKESLKIEPTVENTLEATASDNAVPDKDPEGAQKESTDGRRWRDMYEVPAFSNTKGNEEIVRRIGYTLSFNPKLRIPNWVAWILTKERIEDKSAIRPDSDAFLPDPKVTNCPDRQYNYNKYKYERGHICPAADNRWSEEAMSTCFYMSNICPMSRELNHNAWGDLEDKCRDWAEHRYPTTIYIVAGIVPSTAAKGPKGIPAYVGVNDDIAVPFQIFKAILREDAKAGWTAVGYLFDQTGKVQMMTIDEIEALTGFDLFHNLPDRIETKVESTDGSALWLGSTDIK